MVNFTVQAPERKISLMRTLTRVGVEGRSLMDTEVIEAYPYSSFCLIRPFLVIFLSKSIDRKK
mgnify:CR=1 FL=1